jgi:SUMO ligase MMS21 Smc5/6 complex component
MHGNPATLFEEPCRNKKCGHVYSREAILNYLKTQQRNRRPCKCPTAGCDNLHVTEDQLEKDAMLEIAVNRERRRIDKQRLDRASQASQVEDDDDEEGEGEAMF